jgi:hypothetical protein
MNISGVVALARVVSPGLLFPGAGSARPSGMAFAQFFRLRPAACQDPWAGSARRKACIPGLGSPEGLLSTGHLGHLFGESQV